MTTAKAGSPVSFLSISVLSAAPFTSLESAVMDTSTPAHTLSWVPLRVPCVVRSRCQRSSLSSSVMTLASSALLHLLFEWDRGRILPT